MFQRDFQKSDTIIINIDIANSKTDTIIFEIEIAYFSNHTHPCPGVNFTNIFKQLLRQNPFAKKLQTQIVSTQKLLKKLSYKKIIA